jgi:lipoyl(octanoyl) transferase
MEMVQVSQLGGPKDLEQVEKTLVEELVTLLGYEQVEFSTEALSVR